MKAWIVLLPGGAFVAGLVVFVAMFPFHPTVDLALSTYLMVFIPMALVLLAVGAAAWQTRRSRPAVLAAAAACLAFGAYGAWMVEWDMQRVWDPLFHAPFILGALGCIAFALLWAREAPARVS